MSNITILCVDDEREILEAVERDLAEFEDRFPIETAETAQEARDLLKRIYDAGDEVGLILCDHIMPGEQGVDLFVAMTRELGLSETRKVLLTGQAGLEATVEAINHGDLNYYVAKPWKHEELVDVVRNQLTEYVLKTGKDPAPYMQDLNTVRIMESIHQKGISGNE